jgi:prepilin-type N-terminal cleavage/methylation domain-containing protein
VEPTNSIQRILGRLRGERGFGLVELLVAMVILSVALFALVGTFTTGYRVLTRASTKGTASVLADRTMEAYRGQAYADIVTGTTSTSYSKTSTPSSPDGRTYTVTTVIGTRTATNTGGTAARTVKVITVTVTDQSGRQWASERSTFDPLTGQLTS